MRYMILVLLVLFPILQGFAQKKEMIIRLTDIEVYASHLKEYKEILKTEAEASIRLEPGVISIFPMYRQDAPAQVRILEIYASKEAYEAHLKTPHFLKYKTTTLKMVKSLKLIDMKAMDPGTMKKIFSKLEN